jgi:hypothetical protein
MLTMAVGHSDELEPLDAVAIAIEQCRESLGGASPQAALLLTSFASFDPVVVAAIRRAFPGIHVVGSTSGGEVSSVAGFLEDSMSLALFASDSVGLTVGYGSGLGADVEAACRAAASEALAPARQAPRLALVLAATFSADPRQMTDAMTRAFPEGVIVVGGGSAEEVWASATPMLQFCDDRMAEDGIAVLLFSGRLAVSVAVGTGWWTLGTKGTLTSALDDRLIRIDDRPAIEFLTRYLDLDTTGSPALGFNPLEIIEADTRHSYLRFIRGFDPATGVVQVFGGVPVGATVQLTTAGTDSVIAAARDALARARAGFPDGSRPEAALLVSCVTRKLLLGSRTKVEAEMAREVFGSSIPLAGFYSGGEIAPIGKAMTSSFLNNSFVSILLGT